MTDFALGRKCGLPSGGHQFAAADSARAMPSRKSMAERASPVKPIPVSTRNERRVIPGQQVWDVLIKRISGGVLISSDRRPNHRGTETGRGLVLILRGSVSRCLCG